jgi:hypothetical protein
VQVDVAHQRTDHPALRGARHRAPHRALFHHSRTQKRAQQRQQATVTDAFLDRGHQPGVWNRAEAVGHVRLHHPAGTRERLVHEHLQPVVRRALRAKPERTRQKVGFKDRLKHDLHRSLHDAVPDCGNRQRPPLLGPRLRYEYPPGRDRTKRSRPQLRFQFIEQPGHPVLLDLGQGDLVDARRAVVAAHLAPRPLQNVPAVDLVIQRVESSFGIGLGRPVQRMLQGTDRVEPTLDTWGGTSTNGTHRPLLVNLRVDEAAALPLTGGCVVHPARPVLWPPPTPSRPVAHFPARHRL